MNYEDSINSQIISAIVKWGAITHEDLYSYLNLESKFSTMRVRTHLLAKKNIIKNIKLPNLKKSVLYSHEGTKVCTGDEIKIPYNNHISHDSGLTNICIKLLKLKKIYDINTIKIDESITKSSLVPDAEAYVLTEDHPIQIAIEYEATQKSRNRIRQKFIAYSLSQDYKYVFYFFNSERESFVYANVLAEMDKSKSSQSSSINSDKFFFFVRSKEIESESATKAFKEVFREDSVPMLELLNK